MICHLVPFCSARDSYTCRFCFHVFSELEDKNRYKGGPARSAAKQGPARRLTMDHDVPWCAGGPTTFENVFCACEPCNQSKDLFWWDDLVPLNRAPPTTTFPFIRPTIPKHHWLTMNRRVRVLWGYLISIPGGDGLRALCVNCC